MGQMFFDIGGLTDFLIGQKDQSKFDYQKKSQGIDFEDFLGYMAQKEDVQKQPSGMPESTDIYPGFPPAHPSPEQCIDPCAMVLNNTGAGQSIESFESSIMSAAKLKEIVNSLKISVAIDPHACAGKGYFENPILPGGQQNTTFSNEIGMMYQAGVDYDFEALDLSRFSKLSFTADQLFDKNQQFVQVKTSEAGNTSIDIQIPVEELRQTVKNYPEKITIQIKSITDADLKAINGSRLSAEGITQGGATEASGKYTLFDLRSLVSADDLEQINIIRKSINAVDQAPGRTESFLSEIELLNSLQYDRNRQVIFRDKPNSAKAEINPDDKPVSDMKKPAEGIRSAANSTRNTSFFSRDSNQFGFDRENRIGGNQSSARTSGAEADGYRSGNNVRFENSQSGETGNQATNLAGGETFKQTLVTSSGAGQILNELNSTLPVIPKTGSPPFEFKTSELVSPRSPGSETIEIVDKIIGQIRSKLAVTPEHTRMTIDLKPESLGKIRIDFKYDHEDMKALIQVENSKMKTLLEAELPRLKEELKIDNFKVEINTNNFGQGANTPNQRSRFPHFDVNRMPHQSAAGESDETVELVNADKMEHGYSDGVHGGMVNLLV